MTLTGHQALSVGGGFAQQAAKSGYSIWACSILPEHTHLVLARHTYKVEQMSNLLKGAATRQLVTDERHPLARFANPGKRPPSMWAERLWKVFLDSDEQIENAIRYVVENPIKEGKKQQTWKCVTPFGGVELGS